MPISHTDEGSDMSNRAMQADDVALSVCRRYHSKYVHVTELRLVIHKTDLATTRPKLLYAPIYGQHTAPLRPSLPRTHNHFSHAMLSSPVTDPSCSFVTLACKLEKVPICRTY